MVTEGETVMERSSLWALFMNLDVRDEFIPLYTLISLLQTKGRSKIRRKMMKN
jgi:hypothetical protein